MVSTVSTQLLEGPQPTGCVGRHALSGYGSGKENGNWVCRCWSIKHRSLVRKYLWGLACNDRYLFPPPGKNGSRSDFLFLISHFTAWLCVARYEAAYGGADIDEHLTIACGLHHVPLVRAAPKSAKYQNPLAL